MPTDETFTRVKNESPWTPAVLLPVIGGVSAWLVAWAMGGVAVLNVVGLISVLAGVGWFSFRAFLGRDNLNSKTLREQAAKIAKAEEDKLDDLQIRLRSDRDYRTKEYLTLLRSCRKDFEEIAQTPGLELRSIEVVKQIQQLFWASIAQIEQSLKLHTLAERLSDAEKNRVLVDRERVLTETRESIDHMQNAVKLYREFVDREEQTDLSRLRDDLDASLRIAKRTDERMRELESGPDYESYLKQ